MTPLFGVRVPVQRAHAGRSRKGQRHRDDLHVRRHHRRHLVARAGAAGARGHPAERHAAAGDVGRRRAGSRATPARGAAAYDAAGRPVGREGAREDRRAAAASPAISIGEPRPITHAVKFYEKGDRPLEIVTSRQWFIKTIEFREALLARGRELQWHPAVHAGAVRELDQRPERRLVRQPAAVLRRAVSGLVSARRATARRLRRGRSAAHEDAAADRSVDRRARRLSRRAARRSRAASSAIPTSWTPGRPRR